MLTGTNQKHQMSMMNPFQFPQTAGMIPATPALPTPTNQSSTTAPGGWNAWNTTSFYNPNVPQTNVFGSNQGQQTQLVYNPDPNAYAQDQFSFVTSTPAAVTPSVPALTDPMVLAQMQQLQWQQCQFQQQYLQALQQLQQLTPWVAKNAANQVPTNNAAMKMPQNAQSQRPANTQQTTSASAASPVSPSTVAETVKSKTHVESMWCGLSMSSSDELHSAFLCR